ncbi:hypothetical protein HMPREF9999_00247 [Alloprevotella sp. oral taxon 473 str. F0040]|nr:hypothetical protein HMPREF9999_00247 [Alloprevotella sp. oral taxon 473 str. F0040]
MFCNICQTIEGVKCIFFLKYKYLSVKSDLFLEKAFEICK